MDERLFPASVILSVIKFIMIAEKVQTDEILQHSLLNRKPHDRAGHELELKEILRNQFPQLALINVSRVTLHTVDQFAAEIDAKYGSFPVSPLPPKVKPKKTVKSSAPTPLVLEEVCV